MVSSGIDPDHHKYDGGVDSRGSPALTSSETSPAWLARIRGILARLTSEVKTEQFHAVNQRR